MRARARRDITVPIGTACTYRYRAVPPQQSPAREYAGLAAVLTGQIARSSSDPRRVALAAGQEWGRALVSGQEPAGSPQEARARVLVLLDEIGFAYETDEESRRARLPRCPFIELAREYPGVICAVHAGLVVAGMAALGGEAERVVLQPFAEPGACMLRLDAEPGEGPLAAAPTDAEGRVPVVYQVDLKDPASFFAAQDFPMRHRDVLYVATARGAELQKFLNIVSSVVVPAVTVRNLAP